ncbi:MAG: hypothetical protein ACMZ7B_04535 [Balneola sp.]
MKKLVVLFFIPLIVNPVKAQITGLWEVTKVVVGEEEMTPVAKWSHFLNDGSYTTGNGWLQNGDGTWDFDSASSEMQLVTVTGFDDESGPFEIEMNGRDKMIWSRQEGGDMVNVYYQRIYEIPKSPATLAVGLWMVKEVINNGELLTEKYKNENAQAVFVRWDNLFQEITSEGRISGIWRVNAHRPVLDILFYDGKRPLEFWEIDFENEDTMTWKREGLTIKYERLYSFPD